jgi:hypothetical protein
VVTLKKKNLSIAISIVFIIFFVLYINGCDTDGENGPSPGCFLVQSLGRVAEEKLETGPLQMTRYEQIAYQNKLRKRLQERTGQHLVNWTLEELMALEAELDRMEKEKKEAAQAAQATEAPQVEGLEATQSQATQEPFKSDEGPHKRDPGDRNAPSSGYDSFDDYDGYDEPYYEEQTTQEIVANRDLNGRWRHSSGETIYINGETGTFEVFNPVHQKFVNLGMISIGDVKYHNIRPIGSFSELEDMRWLGGYLLEIKNMVGDGDFSEFAALWRCSRTIFVWDGWTDEPKAVEVDSGERDTVLILLPDGDTLYESTRAARTLQELQNELTYYRVK